MPGTVCTGCHATVINPLGFATEDFDALGRVPQRAAAVRRRRASRVRHKPVDTAVGAASGGGRYHAHLGSRRSDVADRGERQGRGLPRAQLLPIHLRALGGHAVDGCALEEQAARRWHRAEAIIDLVKATALTTAAFQQRRFE